MMSQLTTTPAEPPRDYAPARSRPMWLINLLLALAAILLLLGLVVGAVYWQIHLEHQQALRDVQAELDRIHASGEPITPEDMHRYHQAGPRSAEKAELWLEALKALPEVEDDSEEDKALFAALGVASPLSGDELVRAEAMLEKRTEAMKWAAEAAKIDGDARFPIEFEDGMLALTKHDFELRQLIRWFALRHRVAIARGETDQAIDSFRMMLATADALEYEPLLVSQVTRMAMLRMLFREIPFLIDNLELTAEQLADFQDLLAGIDLQNSFRRALLGERACGYQYLMEDPEHVFGETVTSGGTLRRPEDFRYYLDAMRHLLTATERPLPAARQQAMKVDASVKEILKSGSRSKKRELAGSTLLLPAAISSFDSWANAASDRDSAVAAIAFRRYQLAHGKPPESLAALCPEFLASVPQDPFAKSPAPLRLAVTDDRFAIYSVGKNLTDDRALLGGAKTTDDVGIVVRLSLPSRHQEAAALTDSN